MLCWAKCPYSLESIDQGMGRHRLEPFYDLLVPAIVRGGNDPDGGLAIKLSGPCSGMEP